MTSLSIDPAFGKSRKASKIGFAYMVDGHLGDHGEIPVEDARAWQAGKPVNKQEILFYLRARFELTAVGLDELSAISMGAVWWDRERFNGRVTCR